MLISNSTRIIVLFCFYLFEFYINKCFTQKIQILVQQNCMVDWLIVFYLRLTRKYCIHIETSSPVKGFKMQAQTQHLKCGISLSCHTCYDKATQLLLCHSKDRPIKSPCTNSNVMCVCYNLLYINCYCVSSKFPHQGFVRSLKTKNCCHIFCACKFPPDNDLVSVMNKKNPLVFSLKDYVE